MIRCVILMMVMVIIIIIHFHKTLCSKQILQMEKKKGAKQKKEADH